MDKIKEFIKKNKGCPLTPAATKELLTKFMEFLEKELPDSFDGGLKYGYYYYVFDGINNKLIYGGESGELMPDNYSGICYQFLDDGIYLVNFENGTETNYVYIGAFGIEISTINGDSSSFNINGVTKLNFAQLTHSFDELNPTLKQIVYDAIDDSGSNGVSCTQEQWNNIKALLDKALYIRYDRTIDGLIMIKSATNNIDKYLFGSLSDLMNANLTFRYSTETSKLFAQHLAY